MDQTNSDQTKNDQANSDQTIDARPVKRNEPASGGQPAGNGAKALNGKKPAGKHEREAGRGGSAGQPDALHTLLAEAEAMAHNAHDGHEDRVGAPYFLHAEAVSQYAGLLVRNRHTDPEDFEIKARIVGLLHDVVEDTPTTFAELEALGLPEDCMRAVRLLTRSKNQPYMEYLAQLKRDPLAHVVKLADLIHNSELARYVRAGRDITPEDLVRLEKYTGGIDYLLR